LLRDGQNLCTDGSSSSPYKNWSIANDENLSTSTPWVDFTTQWCKDNPLACSNGSNKGLKDDACYSRTINGYTVAGNISVYKLGATGSPDSGGAFGSGYLGTGRGSAGSGGYAYFYVQSEGQDPGALAQSQTASIYRVLTR
jgi:hypothetical protein